MDVDRGYFPRTGFIDRRCKLRLPSRVYANLHAALNDCGAGVPTHVATSTSEGTGWSARKRRAHLHAAATRPLVRLAFVLRIASSEVPAQAIDLRDGTCSLIALVSCQDGSDYRQIKDMRHFRSPHLLVFNTGSVASDPAETRELTANLR